jgi:hypothetical protein
MNKAVKFLLVAVAILAIGVIGLLAYVETVLPDVDEPEIITRRSH